MSANSFSEIKTTLYDHCFETLAIQFVASNLIKHGFDTSVFYDVSMNKDYLAQDFFLTPFFTLKPEQIAAGILRTNPDVAGFSVLTVFYPEIAKIIKCLKSAKPDLIVICGGPHCILAAEHILENPDIDFIFRGDSDYSLPGFLKAIKEKGKDGVKNLPADGLPGISNMFDGRMIDRGLGTPLLNLDDCPPPYKEAYYKKNPPLKILYTTTASRGCIFNCTYCNSNNIKKIYKEQGLQYYRVRSVPAVVDELKGARRNYGIRYTMFLDNLFAPNNNWLREFSETYRREVNLPYFCETNPNVHTRETIELLADSNCRIIQFGFQSTVEQVRRDILHRMETNDRIRELVAIAKSKGMFVCIDHIANLPGEKKEHLDHALSFYRDLRPNWINLGFLQYYPRADIVEIALAHRVLSEDELVPIARGEHQSSFRLLARSGLNDEYRTLAIKLFCSFKLPRALGGAVLKLLKIKAFEKFLSPLGSLFIYASRILFAYTDRRDFLVRHHIIRNLYVMKILIGEKFFAGYKLPKNGNSASSGSEAG